jgi:hypothetical protein
MSARFMAADVRNIALFIFSKDCLVSITIRRLLGKKNTTQFITRDTPKDYMNAVSAAKEYGLMADMTRTLEKNKIRILRSGA